MKLAEQRKLMAVKFEQCIQKIKKDYHIPENMVLDIDNATGNIYKHEDRTRLFGTLYPNELTELLSIPTQADFDRWEKEILAKC